MKLKALCLVSCLVLSIFSTGCDSDLPNGHFSGNLFQRLEGTQENPGEILRTPVEMNVSDTPSSSKERKKTLQVIGSENQVISAAEITMIDSNHLRILLPLLQSEPFELTKSARSPAQTTCFENTFKDTLELCFDKTRFFLHVWNQKNQQTFALSGNLFAPVVLPPLEKPVALSLSEAIDRALEQNFDSKIAFEHVVQAEHAVRAAYLNLIPHLTSNVIWNAEFGYVSFIATLSTVAPFLLPSYWAAASKAETDLKISQDALTIMRADLAAAIEGLAYSFERDSTVVFLYEKMVSALQGLESQIDSIYALPSESLPGISLEQAKASIQSARNDFNSDLASLRLIAQQDQYALSQSLGYFNPEAVTSVTLGEELDPYTQAKKLKDTHRLAEIAVGRSFELQQLDFLIEVAEKTKYALFFTWLDPTGDPTVPLGFNLIEQVEVSRSKFRELGYTRDRLVQTTFNRAYKAFEDFNRMVEELGTLPLNKNLRTQDPLTDFSSLYTRAFWNQLAQPSDLKTKLIELLAPEVRLINKVADYRSARAQIDRLLLRGYFAKLLPQGEGRSSGPILFMRSLSRIAN